MASSVTKCSIRQPLHTSKNNRQDHCQKGMPLRPCQLPRPEKKRKNPVKKVGGYIKARGGKTCLVKKRQSTWVGKEYGPSRREGKPTCGPLRRQERRVSTRSGGRDGTGFLGTNEVERSAGQPARNPGRKKGENGGRRLAQRKEKSINRGGGRNGLEIRLQKRGEKRLRVDAKT